MKHDSIGRPKRRPINLTIDTEVVAATRAAGLNLSRVTEDALPMRFVVPLRADDRMAMPRLAPVFEVPGQRLVMMTPLARSISRHDVVERVGTLADQAHVIKAALDMLA
jgi:hypothetical protein